MSVYQNKFMKRILISNTTSNKAISRYSNNYNAGLYNRSISNRKIYIENNIKNKKLYNKRYYRTKITYVSKYSLYKSNISTYIKTKLYNKRIYDTISTYKSTISTYISTISTYISTIITYIITYKNKIKKRIPKKFDYWSFFIYYFLLIIQIITMLFFLYHCKTLVEGEHTLMWRIWYDFLRFALPFIVYYILLIAIVYHSEQSDASYKFHYWPIWNVIFFTPLITIFYIHILNYFYISLYISWHNEILINGNLLKLNTYFFNRVLYNEWTSEQILSYVNYFFKSINHNMYYYINQKNFQELLDSNFTNTKEINDFLYNIIREKKLLNRPEPFEHGLLSCLCLNPLVWIYFFYFRVYCYTYLVEGALDMIIPFDIFENINII